MSSINPSITASLSSSLLVSTPVLPTQKTTFTPQTPFGSAPDTPPFTKAVSCGTAWNNHPIVHGLTLGQTLDQTVRFFGHQDALVYGDRDFRLTWREFGAYVDNLACGLMAMGIHHGDKVAIWATNVPLWIPLMFACAKIGAVYIPINMNFKAAEIDGVLKQSDASFLFTIHGYRDCDFVAVLNELIPELKTHKSNEELSCSKYPQLRRIFLIEENAPLSESRSHTATYTVDGDYATAETGSAHSRDFTTVNPDVPSAVPVPTTSAVCDSDIPASGAAPVSVTAAPCAIDSAPAHPVSSPVPSPFNSVTELLAHAASVSPADYTRRQSECRDDVTCAMQFTSGTTGNPKGVCLSHRNIGNNGYWIGACQNLSPRDRVCIPVPLFHCFGMVLGVMACVNHGATMVMLEKYDATRVMNTVQNEKCTALYGVPTMFIQILDHPHFDSFDFSSLRTGIMSGAACPVVRMNQCVEKMHMREITIPYGLTEAGPVMTQTRYFEGDIEKKCFSIGQALPGVEVAIINTQTGAFCDIGEAGEICCRGYNVMNGYYKEPVATYKFIDEFGWLHSGDIGHMDENGYFYITGRVKDLIIRGGENISPKEVEDFLSHINGVRDVQVVAVPSKKYGEQPAAFVIRQKDSAITEQDVLAACKDKIAWFKTPKFIAFVDSYPLTASGKVQKYKLRQMAAELWHDA